MAIMTDSQRKSANELLNLLPKLPKNEAEAYLARIEWIYTAREKQETPLGEWKTWAIISGRGFGKTYLAVQDIWWYAFTNPGVRIGVICATNHDTRKTAFEGESGLMSVIPHSVIKPDGFKKQAIEIHLINDSIIQGYSAEEPNRLRGPSFHRMWCDELASWRYPESFDMAMYCLRLGNNPQCIITTTPKPTKLIIDLVKVKDEKTIITVGSSYENKENLAPSFIENLKNKYEGTRLGRQEIHAEILEDVEGALWNSKIIIHKQPKYPLGKTVVAVDPATSKNENSDETGILVIAEEQETGKYYVLDDLSGRYSPNEWANKTLWAFDKYDCDLIVAEKNQGGDMVESIVRNIRKNVNIKLVSATKGKYVRAEPVAALYEQGKVFHCKSFDLLEDQMTTYTPESKKSPDRMDALVWGLTNLAIKKEDFFFAVA